MSWCNSSSCHGHIRLTCTNGLRGLEEGRAINSAGTSPRTAELGRSAAGRCRDERGHGRYDDDAAGRGSVQSATGGSEADWHRADARDVEPGGSRDRRLGQDGCRGALPAGDSFASSLLEILVGWIDFLTSGGLE